MSVKYKTKLVTVIVLEMYATDNMDYECAVNEIRSLCTYHTAHCTQIYQSDV